MGKLEIAVQVEIRVDAVDLAAQDAALPQESTRQAAQEGERRVGVPLVPGELVLQVLDVRGVRPVGIASMRMGRLKQQFMFQR